MIMNVSSVLGFMPISTINPVYNATKAWMHFWSVNLKEQVGEFNTSLRDGDDGERDGKEARDGSIKVLEIVPPTVETDLHRERSDPDDNKRRKGNAHAMGVEE